LESWQYQSAADLDQSLSERLRRFPREPDMLQYGVRSAAALAMRGWLKAYHRFEIVGRENLPAKESCILVCNHASHLDAPCLMSALPLRRLHRAFSAAAADYFFTSIPRVATAVLIVNALPFHREVHVRQSISLCCELLANPGNILIIFPEGTRSTTGAISEFKPGIGVLLARTNVPVIPCYLDGAFAALPKGAVLPRPKKIRCIVGKPRNYTNPDDKHAARDICHDLQTAVEELRNQET
jgi:1-acyl-sn-glycerol-3-phosphate acyltransferase